MTDERPELPKAYDPKLVEEKWYRLWKERGYFHAEPDPDKQPYCITIPPPISRAACTWAMPSTTPSSIR